MRSVKKGPFVDITLLKKIRGKKPEDVGVVTTWARQSQISPEMIGFTFGVHNGRVHTEVLVTEEMVGHRLGEFAPSKRFVRHGGRIQKDADDAKRDAEIQAAKAARVEADA
ncbi:MAG: 30S ribosomal protein S19 [Candidatus Kaiserbacteria bacterium]|nr:30S ribosomal protein S19 [Candidatus Kaiserbacteria bacterium]